MIVTKVKIDGMMCTMCEAHINEVIRKSVPGAKKVRSSHTKGECTFLSDEIPNADLIISAIAQTGYTAHGVRSKDYEKKFLGIF